MKIRPHILRSMQKVEELFSFWEKLHAEKEAGWISIGQQNNKAKWFHIDDNSGNTWNYIVGCRGDSYGLLGSVIVDFRPPVSLDMLDYVEQMIKDAHDWYGWYIPVKITINNQVYKIIGEHYDIDSEYECS